MRDNSKVEGPDIVNKQSPKKDVICIVPFIHFVKFSSKKESATKTFRTCIMWH